MKLLFVQGGSRWRIDEKANVYTETNFNDSIWRRYKGYCDHLVVLLRKDNKIYTEEEASSKFNKFDLTTADMIALPDLYSPVTNALKLSIREEIKKTIEQAVKSVDKIIIRSLGNIYTNTALQYAKKYNKPYLVEVTGFTLEGMWYHSLRGKIVAIPKEWQYKHLISDAPYVVYVTKQELQKRYPTSGKSIGCSDVELDRFDIDVLENRLDRIDMKKDKELVIGTAGFLDVKFKGQSSVIRAISYLKKSGYDNIQYKLIGAGTGSELHKLACKLGVSSQIIIEGTLPHNQVYDWYDSLDAYIHPGYIEGLCRSIVEAMSRALPVACAAVGGNIELAHEKMLFKKGNVKEIASIILKLTDPSTLKEEARYSYNKAKEYDKDTLDTRRDDFYLEFTGEKK